MSEGLSGFDFWSLRFDAKGGMLAGGDELLAELPAAGATDLFVISHGWNNSPEKALRLYERFLGTLRPMLGDPGAVAAAGLIWPAMRWIDEPDPEAPPSDGGAAGLGGAPGDTALVMALEEVFPGKGDVLGELAALLEARPESDDELARFQACMTELTSAATIPGPEEDNQERELVEGPPRGVFTASARQARRSRARSDEGGATSDAGGAAGVGFARLWDGAKQALRQVTYWEMKNRAGAVGTLGLGPLLLRVHDADTSVRIHLVGHSFGARLVSFALMGLGAGAPSPSPVKSLFLIQGAFSHYAFAERLPHAERSGWLHGMQARVDGPIVVTHSVHDDAVGRAYPVASLLAGQDAAGMDDVMARWGAIGHSGALEVNATEVTLGAVRTAYDFQAGRFLNLDADNVIKLGGPPSGAHSDIFHPEIGWVAAAAAGLERRGEVNA